MAESDKIMFEIYREADYGRKVRVVYFTELTEHNKEFEIARAMEGEHLYDGFITNHRARDAKGIIDSIVQRLNAGDVLDESQIDELLAPYVPA
ncbi:MAG TPA: hypothetical protein VGM03_21090 [Phycisphaerae bacterium]|jgi:hypothetical protein